MKRIFTTPIVSTIGNGTATTFQPTVTVSTPPFGTPAAITGGRPPTAILTAAGVTNIPTTLGNNNMKPECNGASNQQAVIVQQPSNNATATLFNNINNGHHPNIVNFSSSMDLKKLSFLDITVLVLSSTASEFSECSSNLISSSSNVAEYTPIRSGSAMNPSGLEILSSSLCSVAFFVKDSFLRHVLWFRLAIFRSADVLERAYLS